MSVAWYHFSMHYLVALGNPGAEYVDTRHNAGRSVLARVLALHNFPEPVASAKYAALVSEGTLGDVRVLALMPETYMNRSGSAVAKAVTTERQAERLVVIYDDLDLPLGTMRIAFGRGSGGHKGVESVARSLKTKRFARVRIGVSPATPSGVLRKPKGEEAVLAFLMRPFTKKERGALDELAVKVSEALEVFVTDGVQVAMNRCN